MNIKFNKNGGTKMGKKQLINATKITLVCAVIYTILSFISGYRIIIISPYIAISFLLSQFLVGFIFSGIPVYTMTGVIGVVKNKYKRNIERQIEERLAKLNVVESKIELNTKYCSNYGSQIKKEVSYCEFCGNKQ